jgi:hypothetical protein
MAMIDSKGLAYCRGMTTTDRAAMVLALRQTLVLLQRDAVSLKEMFVATLISCHGNSRHGYFTPR